MGRRTYSSEFKLQVVLEALQSDGTDAEVFLGPTTSIQHTAERLYVFDELRHRRRVGGLQCGPHVTRGTKPS